MAGLLGSRVRLRDTLVGVSFFGTDLKALIPVVDSEGEEQRRAVVWVGSKGEVVGVKGCVSSLEEVQKAGKRAGKVAKVIREVWRRDLMAGFGT